MKLRETIFIAFFTLFSIMSFANTNLITINNTTKELIAPKAASYQWYKNGIKIPGSNCANLKVTKAGVYTLETVDTKGQKQTEDINLIINAAGAIIRIYTIGDSTVQTYAAGYYPRMGWGQILGKFFNTAQVNVINKAVGGTSSKSFYNNLWPAIRNVLVAGDYVFIQFGINDRNSADPNRYSPTGGVFEGYLTKFVNEARAKGAIPVLVTTIRRNAWNADGKTVYDAYHDHPVAVRTVAKSLNVPLIDLDARAKVLMESVGQAYTTNFWYNNYAAGEYPNYPNGNGDNVHFQEMGATEMAKLIVDGILALQNDARVNGLIPALYNRHRVSTTANHPTAGIITYNTLYPPGVKITLKARPGTGHSFIKWTDGTGATQLTTNKMHTFTMGNVSLSFKAFFDNNLASSLNASNNNAMEEKITSASKYAYPNPFISQTTLRTDGGVLYKVISTTGLIVESGKANNIITIGKNYASGVYTVITTDVNQQQHVYKVVKQ